MKTKRVAIYARVSTDEQTVENQLQELQAVAERHGWEIAEIFTDEGISGAKGRDKRPGFDALCKGVERRQFDMVAVWALDRLGRSLQDLIGFLKQLEAKEIDLYLDKQGIDTSTPLGRMMFSVVGAFAEYEREIIRERVHSGLARARSQGKRLGRPTVSPETVAAIQGARSEGKSINKIAKDIGVGVGTVLRVLKEAS